MATEEVTVRKNRAVRAPRRDYRVQELGTRETPFGPVMRVLIYADDEEVMSWAEIQSVFNEFYPGLWAFQVHPPIECLIDEVNRYHLWALLYGTPPGNMRIDPH